jgi:uncharacterized membrane protein
MSFTTPWALLLLLLLPVLWAIARPRRNLRETASLLVRSLMLILIILALAGLRQRQTSDDLATIFLLDVSDSVGPTQKEMGLAYVRQALEGMGPDDRGGVILFGTEALVERAVSPAPGLGDPASIPNANYTNIAGAVGLGLTLFPDDAARRLVILSDGQANLGDARQAAELAAAGGVELSVVPLASQIGTEVRLDALQTPFTLHEGEQFDMIVQLHSTQAMSVPLQIFSEGRLVARQTLALQAGDNTFVLPLEAGEPGFTTFRAQIDPPADTFPQNNRLDAFSQVQGPLAVLLVAEHADEGQPLAGALRSAGVLVKEIGPAELPSDLGGLSEFTAVILVNVPSFKLAPRQLDLLQTYVRDLGHGLVAVGGDESYGPGGYYQTPLEETLPVEMVIKDKQRLPGMTLLTVLDKSGSMSDGGTPQGGGPRKVELAKEAVYRSLDLLVPWDRVGVIAFDNAARWVVEPTPAVNLEAIKDAVGTIRADGGTDIFAGLKLAAETIVNEPSLVRHIILLSDGGSNPEGIPELIQNLADQNVTVSVIAIGYGYAPFLEDVARIGGGRFHFTDDATVIPQIFAQETSLASRSYVVEEDFTPAQVGPSPILDGLTSLPPLHGYVATSPKLTAQEVLRGGSEEDPLLAQWQYGLGRAVAWTSDAKGQWATEWLSWDGFPRFWAQVVRWTIVEGSGGGVETQITLAGEQALVTTEILDSAGNYRNDLDVTLSLIDPKLEQQTILLSQTAPGLYEGAFQPDQTGIYLLHVTGQEGEELVAAQTRGFVMSYSPEYRAAPTESTLLADLATIGGGRVLPFNAPAEAFAHTLPPVRGASDLWPWLLAAAILLLPLDVGLRRISFGGEELRELWVKIGRYLPKLKAAAPQPKQSSAGRLLQVKGKRDERAPEETPHPDPISLTLTLSQREREQEAASPSPLGDRRKRAGGEGLPAPLGDRRKGAGGAPPKPPADAPPAETPPPAEEDESTVQRLMRVKRKRRE